MYAFMLSLLVLVAPFRSLFADPPLVSGDRALFPFEVFWSTDYGTTDCFITLPDRFMFEDVYTTYAVERGMGCILICKPLPGYDFYHDRDLLKEMKLTVVVTNSQIKGEVDYAIYAEAIYEEAGWVFNGLKTHNLTLWGALNGKVDETTRPMCVKGLPSTIPVDRINFSR